MEVYILKQYDPDDEQDKVIKVFDSMWKATEYVYQFSSSHYGRDGVSIVENSDYAEYTVRTKDGGVLFMCETWEVE